ncbi:MAG: DUF4397 domain-containing protein [Myxococcales bacterium]|nr:DUF4397 domain-containing protein [Myxococcales bacterium]
MAAVIGVASLALAGCEGDDDSGGSGGSGGATGGTGGGSTGGMAGMGGMAGTGGMAGMAGMGGGDGGAKMAKIRVVHASSSAPAVDLYPAGGSTPIVSNLAYGKGTDYLELPPGAVKIDIRAAGSPATGAPVFTTPDISLMADKKYTAIAAGDIGSTNADDKFRVIALEEGFGAPASGAARVRIVHASFDAPTVDIDVGNDDPTKAEIKGVARFADTGASGVDIPGGAAAQVGIAAGGKTVTAFTTPPLPAGAELFVIAAGQLGKLAREDAGFQLIGVLPTGGVTVSIKQNPRVYALHASPDAGNVDIYAGTAELVDNAGFGALAPLQVPPGAYTLDFFPGKAGATPKPSGSPAASATTPALEAGQSYLAIAAGELTATTPTFSLIALQEGFDLTDSAKGRVRVVHASGNAPAVDIGPAAGGNVTTKVLSNVKFKDASPAAGLSLDAGALTLGVAAAGTTATVAEFPLTIAAGQRTFGVAAGKLGGTANKFQILAVDAKTWTVAAVPSSK